jgi:hypothetical protein
MSVFRELQTMIRVILVKSLRGAEMAPISTQCGFGRATSPQDGPFGLRGLPFRHLDGTVYEFML